MDIARLVAVHFLEKLILFHKSRRASFLVACALYCCASSVQAATDYKACDKSLSGSFDVLSSGWSRELKQQRMYDLHESGLNAGNLQNLHPAWAFVFEGANQPRSLPAITRQAIFIGSQEGALYALDTNTGCGFWRFQADKQIRTAVSIANVGSRWLIFFGDNSASAYAVDAHTGELVWKRQLDDYLMSVITGSPVFYQGNLFVPVASWSVGLALNPWGDCCKFRGSLASLNALTGELNWQNYTIAEKAKATGRNLLGGQRYGPSGAGVWSAPTIDEKRQRIYIGTGQNYSSPTNNTSDAILAFDLNSGDLLWSKQVLPEDGWNVACEFSLFNFNCPEEDGLDYDFGAPPILVTQRNGKDIILGGTKGGMTYAFDPDQEGKILWQQNIWAWWGIRWRSLGHGCR